MTFSVDDFTIDEVYQILNHGDKFAIYLMKENLTIIRGRAIYTGMNLKQNNNNNNKLKKESIMEELKAGDVVCFKSGSPNMTIEHITDTTIKEAECVWFVNDNLFKGIFAVDSLTMPETSKDSKEG